MSLRLLVPLLACTGCLFVTDAGELISQTREVPAFDALDVQDGLNVKVRIGPRQDARIFGHERLLEDLLIHEKEGRLIVERQNDTLVFSEARADIELTTPALVALTASGGSNVTTQEPIDATRFVLDASGGSQVLIASLASESVELDASGGSVVTATGTTVHASIEASGGSVVDLHALAARRVTVDGSGGSTLKLNATDEVRGSASGGSVLKVSGLPVTVDVNLSGGSVLTEE